MRLFSAALLGAGVLGSAHANLGEAVLQTALGQPLRATVPVIGQNAVDMSTNCFRLYRTTRGDGVPTPNDLSLVVEEANGVRRLVVRTRSPVHEPAIRFGVETMCGQSIRREYTFLLDPNPIADEAIIPLQPAMTSTPLPMATGSATGSADGLPPPVIVGEIVEARPARAPRAVNSAGSARSSDMPVVRRARAATTRELATSKLSVRGGLDSLSRDLDLTALAVPRLRLSHALLLGSGAQPMSEVDRAVMASKRNRILQTPIDADIRPQLEVDLMIAQKRIAELQARLGTAADTSTAAAPPSTTTPPLTAAADPAKVTDMPSANAAGAVTPTPQPTLKPTAPGKVGRDREPTGGSMVDRFLQWLWLPLLLGAGALVGAYYWLKRKSKQEQQERAYAAAAAAVGLNPGDEGDMAAGGFVNTRMRGMGVATRMPDSVLPRAPAPTPTPPSKLEDTLSMDTVKGSGGSKSNRMDADLFNSQFDATQLGVSMVSAITEEAGVYVELGRIDEAIAVLKDHIDVERAYNRATPAPWLMLLDLYHRTNNRPEFETLRSEFMNFFNGKIPEWGAFDEGNGDKSLAEHDHIMERLEKYWGTPACHAYLNKLMHDHRDHSRMGFSLTAYRELVLLDSIHNSAFPIVDQVNIEMPNTTLG